MKMNLDALQSKQAHQAEQNAQLLEVLMKMEEDQKQNAVSHANALEKQKQDYEKMLNGNQEEIKKLQLEQEPVTQKPSFWLVFHKELKKLSTSVDSLNPQLQFIPF